MSCLGRCPPSHSFYSPLPPTTLSSLQFLSSLLFFTIPQPLPLTLSIPTSLTSQNNYNFLPVSYLPPPLFSFLLLLNLCSLKIELELGLQTFAISYNCFFPYSFDFGKNWLFVRLFAESSHEINLGRPFRVLKDLSQWYFVTLLLIWLLLLL